MSKIIIYSIKNPQTGKVFFLGRTKLGLNRVKAMHQYSPTEQAYSNVGIIRNTELRKHLTELRNKGVEPLYEIMDSFDKFRDADLFLYMAKKEQLFKGTKLLRHRTPKPLKSKQDVVTVQEKMDYGKLLHRIRQLEDVVNLNTIGQKEINLHDVYSNKIIKKYLMKDLISLNLESGQIDKSIQNKEMVIIEGLPYRLTYKDLS